MTETFVLDRQLIPVNQYNPGTRLTAKDETLYSRQEGNIMPEDKVEVKKAENNGAVSAIDLKNSVEEQEKTYDELLPEAKEVIDKEVENNQNNWEQWIEKSRIQGSEYTLVISLMQHGVTLEQYLKDKEYFQNNRILYENNKQSPKEIARLINLWKQHFDKTDKSRQEYERKQGTILTLAIAAGLSPREFAKFHSWSAYFETEPPQTPIGVIKAIVKDIITEVIVDTFYTDDPNLSPEENHKLHQQRKQKVAGILWGAVNQKREEAGEVIGVDEKNAQQHAINLGITPNPPQEEVTEAGIARKDSTKKGVSVDEATVFINSRIKDDDIRSAKAEEYLRVLDLLKEGEKLNDEQKAALIKAHHIREGERGLLGSEATIYDYTQKQILEKARILRVVFSAEQTRALMEAGLAGNSDRKNPEESEQKGRSKSRREKENEEANKEYRKLRWEEYLRLRRQNLGGELSAKELQWASEQQEKGLTPEEAFLAANEEAGPLTTQQHETVRNLRRMLGERGVSVDFDNPDILRMAEIIARMHPPTQPITEQELNNFITLVLSQQNKGIREASQPQEITPEEIQNNIDSPELIDSEEKPDVGGMEIEDPSVPRKTTSSPGVPPEQIQKAEDAWARVWQADARAGRAPTQAEVDRIRREHISKGFMPPISGASGKLLPFERGRGRHGGGPAIWESVQAMRAPGAINPSTGQLYTENEILREEKSIYEYENPKNVHDFAWQIGMSSPEKYGVLGEHPVLEVVYLEDGVGRDNGETYNYKRGGRVTREKDLYNDAIVESRVNKGNFIRWVRDRMMYLHGDYPDDELNFAQQIYLTKVYSVNLDTALNSPDVFFRDERLTKARIDLRSQIRQATTAEEKDRLNAEYKKLPESDNMTDLFDEIKRMTWAFSVTRNYDLNYRDRSGAKDQFVEMMTKIFSRSPFTKTVWGKSLMEWVLTWDQHYKAPHDQEQGDNKVGAAIAGAYQVYYNLTDTERLRKFLGPQSALLTREGLKRVRDNLANLTADERIKDTDTKKVREQKQKNKKLTGYLSDSDIDNMFEYSEEEIDEIKNVYQNLELKPKNFRKVGERNGKPIFKEFDANGNEVVNEWRFIKTMNVFSTPQFNARKESILHAAIREDIAKKFNLKVYDEKSGKEVDDALNVEFAQLFAYTMSRWTGAQARNNQTAAGYDAWVALIKTRTYRRKYSEADRSESFGNPYTIDQIRGLNTDLMTGIRTETRISKEEIETKGSRYSNRSEKSGYKTPLEVMEEMLEAWKEGGQDDKKAAQLYEGKSGQLLFPGNTLKYFAFDQIRRGMEIYEQIIQAQEIKLEKFTKIDPLKGVTFERDQFQVAVQDKFLKPMRYLLSTWRQVDFAQVVWDNRGEESKTAWKQVTMAEKMFGRQMLDVPEFWERIVPPEEGSADYDEKMRQYNARISQNDVVKVKTRDAEGRWDDTYRIRNQISGKEINDNRTQLIKQLAKTRIAAELYEHVDLHSNDQRYDFRFYETIIQALERLPGGIESGELNMRDAKTILDPDKRYFSGDDIEWIRKNSHTERWRIYGWAILKSILWDGIIKGGLEGLGKFQEATLSQKELLKT